LTNKFFFFFFAPRRQVCAVELVRPTGSRTGADKDSAVLQHGRSQLVTCIRSRTEIAHSSPWQMRV